MELQNVKDLGPNLQNIVKL